MTEKIRVPDEAWQIRDDLVQIYGEKLKSVLLYGSSLIKTEYWDLDIFILLDNKSDSTDDLDRLKAVWEKHQEQTLDLQLFYTDEVSDSDLFSLDAHGSFFVSVLAQAETLHGDNPFVAMTQDDERVAISLLNRIQRYIFQTRQEYLGNIRHVKDKNPLYHPKHVRRCMLDVILMLDEKVTLIKVDEDFKKYFPDCLSEHDWEMLNRHSDDVRDYVRLYEKVYIAALNTAAILVPKSKSSIKHGKHNEMAFAYTAPTSNPTNAAVILLDGLPRVPELNSTMNLLSSWGFTPFFLRLKGTWESDGTFLDHDPVEDVAEFARLLKQGIALEQNTITYTRVIVIGASFGGSVALGGSMESAIDKVVALSPVYQMSGVAGIDTLKDFLVTTFTGAYRFKDNDMDALTKDAYLSFPTLVNNSAFDPQKCTVLFGKFDPQISADSLRQICTSAAIPHHELTAKHLSLSRNTNLIRPILYKILSEKE